MTLEYVEEKIKELFTKHNLNDWKFQWMKRMSKFSRAGSCNYKNKVIKMSPTFVELNSEEHVNEVMLHEIAHALMPRHHHNKFWKRKALEIGCTGNTYYSKEVKRKHD